MGSQIASCNPLAFTDDTSDEVDALIIQTNQPTIKHEDVQPHSTSDQSDRIMDIYRSVHTNDPKYEEYEEYENTDNGRDYYAELRDDNKLFIEQYGSYFATICPPQSETPTTQKNTILSVMTDINEYNGTYNDTLRDRAESVPIPMFFDEELEFSQSQESSVTISSLIPSLASDTD